MKLQCRNHDFCFDKTFTLTVERLLRVLLTDNILKHSNANPVIGYFIVPGTVLIKVAVAKTQA